MSDAARVPAAGLQLAGPCPPSRGAPRSLHGDGCSQARSSSAHSGAARALGRPARRCPTSQAGRGRCQRPLPPAKRCGERCGDRRAGRRCLGKQAVAPMAERALSGGRADLHECGQSARSPEHRGQPGTPRSTARARAVDPHQSSRPQECEAPGAEWCSPRIAAVQPWPKRRRQSAGRTRSRRRGAP
jgi:hypothetical protein